MDIANLLLRSSSIYETSKTVFLNKSVTSIRLEITNIIATTAIQFSSKAQLSSRKPITVKVNNPPEYIELPFNKCEANNTLKSQLSQLYG